MAKRTVHVELRKTVQIEQFEPEMIVLAIDRELEDDENASAVYQDEFDRISDFIDEKIEERLSI